MSSPIVEQEFEIGLSDTAKATMSAAITAAVKANLITPYSTSATYAVGDFVYYSGDGKIYKCTTAISTAEAWTSGHWTEATLNDIIDAVNEAVASVNNKVDPDDICPDLRAGYADNADQLNSPDFTTDQSPYLFRTSGGDADIGNREKDTVVGGSIGWNQLVNPNNFEVSYGTLSGSTYTFTTVGSTGTDQNRIFTYLGAVSGHKYLVVATYLAPKGGSSTINDYSNQLGTRLLGEKSFTVSANTKTTISFVFNAGATGSTILRFGIPTSGTNEQGDTVDISNIMCIDLTDCLGPTIADYIYSIETATADAGVAWFRKYFPKPYYPYKAIGGFLHVKLTSHDMVGFNQWDEVAEVGGIDPNTGANNSTSNIIRSKNYIRVFPNTTYFFKCPASTGGRYFYYDVDKKFISAAYIGENSTFAIPSNAHYLRFTMSSTYGTTYKGDININLSWSGWRNGQYEAYKKNSYPLDTSVILRGIPKLDADNNLYYDGDRYEYTGKVTRKFGIVDLGARTWAYQAIYGSVYGFVAYQAGAKQNGNATSDRYRCTTDFAVFVSNDKIIRMDTNAIEVIDSSYTDPAAFKTAMSGVYLIYELAEPTEETADSFQETQEVDDFGTEEYVVPEQDGVQVPVGHYTEYPENLRDKLRRLPNMPTVSESTTATYVVNYNGQTKKCSFVPINDWLVANGYPTGDALKEVLASKEALGGTLRQLLAATQSVDFANTDYVDLGDTNWSRNTSGSVNYFATDSFDIATRGASDAVPAICTKYQSQNVGYASDLSDKRFFTGMNNGVIYVRDDSYTDTTAFKAAMKGVLLAYQKAE